jgi:hypothetical protein
MNFNWWLSAPTGAVQCPPRRHMICWPKRPGPKLVPLVASRGLPGFIRSMLFTVKTCAG